jgi:hypothetical protein
VLVDLDESLDEGDEGLGVEVLGRRRARRIDQEREVRERLSGVELFASGSRLGRRRGQEKED